MTFEEACKEKFRRGQIEYNGRWEDIQPAKEMMEEFLDLANYAQHPKFVGARPVLAKRITSSARIMWELLNQSDCP